MKWMLYAVGIALMLFGCKEKKTFTPILDSEPEYSKSSIPPAPVSGIKVGNSIKINPIEHATVVLEWDNIVIYVDPVGGAQAFEGQKKPDLILITHTHGDHLSVETLQALDTERAKIIVPQTVADKLPKEFVPQIDVLNNGDSKQRYGITVKAIPMYNLREEAKKFHVKGLGNGYVLEMKGKRIYFSGDTEDIPEMRKLQNIDIAFVCMNLPYTMTVESAADAVLEFVPKQVYPYHYRGKPDVSDVALFKRLVEQGNSNIEVIQLDWYPNDEF